MFFFPKVEPWIEDVIKLLVHMQRHSSLNEQAKIHGIRTQFRTRVSNARANDKVNDGLPHHDRKESL